jgi:uncharacterized integral membrane protein
MKLSRFITIPLALLLIAFAIANRKHVALSFDPFSTEAPALSISLPLWGVAFGAFLSGVVVGGLTAWITRLHRHLRRNMARRAAAKADLAAVKALDDPLEGLPRITPRAAPPAPARRSLLGRLTKRIAG